MGTRPRSPCPGAVPRPSPPPGPGGAACDRVPGSRRAPGPGRRRAGACDLRPGSARAERPGAPASDRPPSAAPGPRPVLPLGVAPDKGTREPGSGRRPGCAAAPQRPHAPACTTTLGESGEGPLNLRSRDPSGPLTSGQSPGDPPPIPSRMTGPSAVRHVREKRGKGGFVPPCGQRRLCGAGVQPEKTALDNTGWLLEQV